MAEKWAFFEFFTQVTAGILPVWAVIWGNSQDIGGESWGSIPGWMV